MIYVAICDYCGDRQVVKESEAQSVSARCPKCRSKRRMQKHAVIDGYLGCPPFPSKTMVLDDIEPYDYVGSPYSGGYSYD
jgi:DNA-directed RNA polymerase subunit RPC12/RpoP